MAGTTIPPDDEADDEANGGVQLFSRGRLVASLAAEKGLEACILTTYAVELPDLEEEFPALFSPQSRVPTLLLHGGQARPPALRAGVCGTITRRGGAAEAAAARGGDREPGQRRGQSVASHHILEICLFLWVHQKDSNHAQHSNHHHDR